jgi:hypothetical protein
MGERDEGKVSRGRGRKWKERKFVPTSEVKINMKVNTKHINKT